MNYKDMGARIRKVRKRSCMTQEQLAEKVGISPSYMGHIERGTRSASLDVMVSLCNVLSVTPEYLLQASLDSLNAVPAELNEWDKEKLIEFLRFAQDTVRGWKT